MLPANSQAPAFQLDNQSGDPVALPDDNASIICFVKQDCPTCQLVMPVLEQLHAEGHRIIAIGQTTEGNQQLITNFNLTLPFLDDSKLKISFAFDIDTVPTLIPLEASGNLGEALIGFTKEEWQTAFPESAVDWPSMPDWRPGCGSLSVDPLIADRLRAEAENSPLRARKIEIASGDDEFEFMFDQGFSDGLPLVPPTPERVIRMLSGTSRDPQDIVAVLPPNLVETTVEKVAINAVMAGCKPEYFPVVLAALEAACTDEFNAHGVMSTTMGASPVIVVNGPIRDKIGMNSRLSALGQGNRANATIGRAVRLAIRNIGGAQPGGTERSTLGSPMKFTMCFAEAEERSTWEPLHVERGFNAEDSVVTLFGMTSGPVLIVDQTSVKSEQLARSMAMSLQSVHHPKSYMSSDTLLVVCPEHLDTLERDGHLTKAELRSIIQDELKQPLESLVQDDHSGVGITAASLAKMDEARKSGLVNKFPRDEDIHIVVAGSDAGKFSGAFHGWATGPIGTISVSKKIED
jgi:thiol-disulfide isomerase/thioredoxin